MLLGNVGIMKLVQYNYRIKEHIHAHNYIHTIPENMLWLLSCLQRSE